MAVFKNILKNTIKSLGYDIRPLSSIRTHDMDKEFWPINDMIEGLTMTTVESRYSLYRAVRHIVERDIPGVFAECGVWKGGSCLLIAETLNMLGVHDRPIYLFDTFAGMTMPTDKDIRASSGEKAMEKWQQMQREDHNEWCYGSLEDVKRTLSRSAYPAENYHFIQGDVLKTIPEQAPEQIAILRLDTDWYESTRHELDHLYPRISRGGFLIVDDYGALKGAREATDEYIAEYDLDLFLNRIDFSVRMGRVFP